MRRKLALIAVALLLLSAVAVPLALRFIPISRLASRLHRAMLARVGGDATMPKIELSPSEQEIVAELNLARTNPRQYADYLEAWKRALSGNRLMLDAQRTISLNEGASAVDEAISFLRAAQPLPPLSVSKGMSSGASDQAKDVTRTGGTGHRGSDGSLPDQRVNRYGSFQGSIGENIAYASGSAREAVLGMIVDDGVPGRGHRLNIFNPAYRTTGVAAATQPVKNATTFVVTFAGGFVERATAGAGLRQF